jgi:DNA (cytosine-5)-methyltransferase 1
MATITPKIIDLFAGVGGLTLGAARAGFRIGAAVDLDPHANAYHQINFPNATHLTRNISILRGRDLLADAGLRQGELAGLIGGPPCQGFSEVGLRAPDDPRNSLFMHFFRLVAETRPAFYVAENVPGLLFSKNSQILTFAQGLVPKNYRSLQPFLVTASEYGAPTTRKRVFFVGYDPNRVNALQPSDFDRKRIEDVRVIDALTSLPRVRSTWQSASQAWRSVGDLGAGRFARRITGYVPDGVGDPEALRTYRRLRQASGFFGTVHTTETLRRFSKLKPGNTDAVSRCPRLAWDGYCPTLRAGTGSDRGSFQAIRPIHPSSHRVISPREAARLQGFPDWFQFHPTKWHSFRQIGNSVSPLVAEILLRRIFNSLR